MSNRAIQMLLEQRRKAREAARDISEKSRRYYIAHAEQERQRARERYWADPEAGRAAVAYQRKKKKLLEAVDEQKCHGADEGYEDAEQDGRLVVLPFPKGSTLVDHFDPERPELITNFRIAATYNHRGIVFHQPFNIFMMKVKCGYISPVSEEAEAALKGGSNEADSV